MEGYYQILQQWNSSKFLYACGVLLSYHNFIRYKVTYWELEILEQIWLYPPDLEDWPILKKNYI